MQPSFNYHHYEEAYFRNQEASQRRRLKEHLDTQAQAVKDQDKLAEQLGADDDQALAGRARDLGFDEQTAQVLHLVPLVHVAWADGSVSARERLTVMQAAHTHGAQPGSRASTFLASLLEHRPSDAWFEQTEDLLRAMVRDRETQAHDIVDLCRRVARASGGLLGLYYTINEQEAKLIDKFHETLEPQARRHLQAVNRR